MNLSMPKPWLPTWFARNSLRGAICIAICLLMAACGFQLKGASPLPFKTIYTNIPENSEFGSNLRRAIVASSPGTRFVDEPGEAEALLLQLSNNQHLRELSIDAQGRVEEYELNLEFVFELTDAKRRIVLPPTTLRATREIPYDDSIVQAKQSEIENVFRQMRQSLVDRMLRLLSSPDVTAAFLKAESLPVDETPASAVPPATEPLTPSPWGAPRIVPKAGIY